MCQSIYLVAEDKSIETVREFITHFGDVGITWFDGRGHRYGSVGEWLHNVEPPYDFCICGMAIEKTAAGLGYRAERDTEGDPMRYNWVKL